MPMNLGSLIGGMGNIVGGNNGQGGMAPQLNAMAEQNRQRQQAEAVLKLLAAQQQGGGQPGQQPMPGGPPAPAASPGGMPIPGAPLAGAGGAMPQQMTPKGDINSLIATITSQPGDPLVKYNALKEAGAFLSPYEKMTNQMTMAQQKMDAMSENMRTRMDAMAAIAAANRNQKTESQTTGRDIVAVEKELSDQRGYLSSILNSQGASALKTPEYKEAKAQYDALKQELEGIRKGGGGAAPKAGAPTEAAPDNTQGAMVDVLSPDGTPGQIPAANLDAAIAKGYKKQ